MEQFRIWGEIVGGHFRRLPKPDHVMERQDIVPNVIKDGIQIMKQVLYVQNVT